MIDREDLNLWKKSEGFKKAFITFKHYMVQENYIGAYVIAFSILEDRINAIYYTRQLIDSRVKPKGHIPLSRKLNHIVKRNDVNKDEKEKWQIEANRRNHKFHQAMWNIHEFSKEDCERVIKFARDADELRSDQKRAYRM